MKKLIFFIALPIVAFIAISVSSLRFRITDNQYHEMWE
jgi:hypothetical protein